MNALPEDCVSTILSLTTPRDACQSSLVSSFFRFAADSDVVWEKFLPTNYPYILSKSVSCIAYSSKKELFFRLQDPIILNGGNKIFWLEPSNGKISYMLSARELSIAGSNDPENSIAGSNDPTQWTWLSLPESRFSNTAELRSTTRLEVEAKIKPQTLSPKTNYAAYLVMKFTDSTYGLSSLPSELTLEAGDKVSKSIAYLCRNDGKKQWLEDLYYSNRVQVLRSRVTPGEERVVQERKDGWMEVELGSFFNDGGDCEIKMSLMEVKGEHLKGGLVIEGIELRPKV